MDDDGSLNSGKKIANKVGRVFKDVLGRLNAAGHELLDPTPRSMTVKFKARAPTMAEQVQDMLRQERIAQAIRDAGYETFDESEDFDVEDDPLPPTPWEYREDQENDDRDYRRAIEEIVSAGKANSGSESEIRGSREEAQSGDKGDKPDQSADRNTDVKTKSPVTTSQGS